MLIEDRFLLRRQLGRGGAATIWLASDMADERDVAVKLLHPKFRTNKFARARLAREASLLSKLHHPNIAESIDLQLERIQPFFAMEFLEGVSLDHAIGARAETDDYYTDEEVLRLFGQMCGAVGFAHEREVIHRDLKPSNVMVVTDADGHETIKILDFGIAKILNEGTPDTTEGRAVGSLSYMSPEQAEGQRVDSRTDVFALGVILFELLTLRRVWARQDDGAPLKAYISPIRPNRYNSIHQLAMRISTEERPRASEFRSGVRPEVDEVIIRTLSIDRDVRFATAAELLAALPDSLCVSNTGGMAREAALQEPLGGASDGHTAVRPSSSSDGKTAIRDDGAPMPQIAEDMSEEGTALRTVSSPQMSQDQFIGDEGTAIRTITSRVPARTRLTSVGDDTRLAPVITRLRPGPSSNTGLKIAVGVLSVMCVVLGVVALVAVRAASRPVAEIAAPAVVAPTSVGAVSGARPEEPALVAPPVETAEVRAPREAPTRVVRKPAKAARPSDRDVRRRSIARLRAQFIEARKNQDVELLKKVGRGVTRQASGVKDDVRRRKIERWAEMANLADFKAIESAIEELSRN